jgi:hypothetical protein
LLFAFALSSCKKDDNLGEADRIFAPVGIMVTTSSGIGVCDLTVNWNAMPGVSTYTIELSADSLQFQNIIEKFVTRGVSYTFPSLLRGQRVSIRLRCNSDNLNQDSRFIAQTLIIPIENIFYPSLSGDVKATSITVRFQPGALATSLKLINKDTGENTVYPLSESNIADGVYKMTGVDGNSNYTIEIYYEDIIRGQKQVTTAYAPTGPNVVYLPDGVSLSDVLTNADNIGKILILPEDYVYTMTSTITIAGGMTIYGNPDGERALIQASGSAPGSFFILPPNATTTPIEFVYCNFDRGNPQPGNIGEPGTYMFNMSNAFGKMPKLAYTNCRMANFGRNFFRVQGNGAGVIDSLVIDNCEFERMGIGNGGDYAFLHMDVAGMVISNIKMTNSTFNIVGAHFIYFGQSRTAGCKSVDIEYCTFYNMMYSGSARWFINLGNVNNPENSVITLKNLILGSTVLTSTADPKPVHDCVKRDNVSLTVEEVYQTNDWVVKPATNLDDAKVYNGSATDLFTDPAKGKFSIKDAGFAGKITAGDPRWK